MTEITESECQALMAAMHTDTTCTGQVGPTGSKRHLVFCNVEVVDAGKPWERKLVRNARTFCSSGRRGYQKPHSLRFVSPTDRTVTCELCLDCKLVEKAA